MIGETGATGATGIIQNAFSVAVEATQTITPPGTPTIVQFTDPPYFLGTGYSTVSHQYTVPVGGAGRYKFDVPLSVQITGVAALTTVELSLTLYLNGAPTAIVPSSVLQYRNYDTTNPQNIVMFIAYSTMWELADNNTVEVRLSCVGVGGGAFNGGRVQ